MRALLKIKSGFMMPTLASLHDLLWEMDNSRKEKNNKRKIGSSLLGYCVTASDPKQNQTNQAGRRPAEPLGVGQKLALRFRKPGCQQLSAHPLPTRPCGHLPYSAGDGTPAPPAPPAPRLPRPRGAATAPPAGQRRSGAAPGPDVSQLGWSPKAERLPPTVGQSWSRCSE